MKMVQLFCYTGKRITLLACAVILLVCVFESFAKAVFIAYAVVSFYGLQIIFFCKEGTDKNTKTALVAQIFTTALLLFALLTALIGAGVVIVVLQLFTVFALTYLTARIGQVKDGRYSLGLLFVVVLPFGFLFVEALKLMSSKKKES